MDPAPATASSSSTSDGTPTTTTGGGGAAGGVGSGAVAGTMSMTADDHAMMPRVVWPAWDLRAFIVKSNDDLRQEVGITDMYVIVCGWMGGWVVQHPFQHPYVPHLTFLSLHFPFVLVL